MSNFKEFQAKNLDQAIADACTFYGTDRVKLEINIMEDAKTGVFGLIGARKARIQARLAQLPNVSLDDDSDVSRTRKNASRNQVKSAKGKNKSKLDKIEEQIEQSSTKDVLATEEKPRAKTGKNNLPDGKKNSNYKKTEKPSQVMEYDEEEGESQSQFLSNSQGDDEILEDHILEALDREAMEKANLFGNVTEAEIRANNDFNERSSNKGMRKSGRKNEKERNYKDKSQAKREKQDYRADKTERQNSEKPERQAKQHIKNDVQLSNDEIKQLDPEERRQYYIQKRQTERESRPPKQFVATEYEASPLPRLPLTELDQEKLINTSIEVIRNLVSPIVGEEAPINAVVADDRVQISIESDDTGLLIGKEGQNLAAIQYLSTRIVTRKMESQIRIQVDTGDYHSRQDSRLEFLAQTLAERVKEGGRPQSTRPLSAYQRRLIHLTLQDDPEVITRSCGEGSLKRVVVMRKRFNEAEQHKKSSDDLGLNEQNENYEDDFINENLMDETYEEFEVSEDYTIIDEEFHSDENPKQ